jgi:PleD family two-component response regulator
MNHGKDRHAAGAYPPSESFAQNAAKARIVIVDDDESIALLVRRSLDRPEYHFDICAGGEAALARIV